MPRFIAAGLLMSALLLAGCQPYSQSSVWNQTASSKGTVTSSNPYASYFPGAMFFGGLSGGDQAYKKPIFMADANSPCRGVTLSQPSWNTSNTRIPDNDCIPVPSGVAAATGSDGHLTIVSSDLSTAWSFWRCSPCTEASVLANRYLATNGSKWNLSGSGIASCCGSSTGRGSGTELLTTVIKAVETFQPITHAFGVTVSCAGTGWIYPPAIKSDGDCSSGPDYGTLLVLRSDYPCPSPVGLANVCAALKTYGFYVVDQEGFQGWEMDTTGPSSVNTAANWSAAGISRNSLPLQGSDLRCVNLTATAANDC